MNELHKNFHSIQINITPHTFAGLAKQNMAFHQGVMELCGNAIAAALPGEKALIFIGLAPGSAKDELLLVVADWGSGMDLSQLENALQLGSLPTGSNRLNEHGFGINNALASLTGGDRPWALYTRARGAAGYLKVQGPFTPQMTVEEVDTPALPQELTLPRDHPGTVYCIHVPLAIAQSVQGLGAKAKYYYQGNQPTQGVNIRLGKRVIATAQLSEIWRGPNGMPLARHNNYNEFVGEVLLPELPRGVLSTLNNKTNLNPNDPDWQNLFSLLAQVPPLAHPKACTEKALQSRWISALLAVNPQDG